MSELVEKSWQLLTLFIYKKLYVKEEKEFAAFMKVQVLRKNKKESFSICANKRIIMRKEWKRHKIVENRIEYQRI